MDNGEHIKYLIEMKNLKQLSVFLFSLLILTAWKTDSKLKPLGIEKAVKEFMAFNNSSANAPRLSILEMQKIDTIHQVSEKKATCWVKFKAKLQNMDSPGGKDLAEAELNVEFEFAKSADNKWILTFPIKAATKVIRWQQDNFSAFMEQSQHLSILAQ